MNWKENFDINKKNQNHNYTKHYHPYDKDRYDGFTCNHPSKIHYAVFILRKLWSNKKMRVFMILSLVMLKVLFILLFTVVLPACTDLTDGIKQEGIKEIFESITGFLIKLWK
jgi:hypothetical protein